MHALTALRITGWGIVAAISLGAGIASAQRVDFDRQILPILSDNCYKCHGPDEGSRKAHLRLDTREGAFAVREGKGILVPGKSDQSELVRRITSADSDQHMPPPASQRKLTAAQIELIRNWVDQGAKWETHWAFVPPAANNPPAIADPWCRNDIDRFVLADLTKAGLRPSKEAARERLIRRVSFDLTGLPPTPAETSDFVHDASPNAYEKVIDQLLASPRYGERMAVIWLDLARFADTHGYQSDRYRAMWPWRDWVIKAFNANQPYDQFVTWQLAGDLLPHATQEQRLATAFNRLHMQNEEGGIVEEEFRVAYNVDRVDTFGTAFLGLTFECTRCHDHKFDPLTQKDFYSLFAFFQNVDEPGQTPFFTEPIATPTLLLSDPATDKTLAGLREKIADKNRQADAIRKSEQGAFNRWLADKGALPKASGLVGDFDFEQIKDGKIANAADPTKPGIASDNPVLVDGKFGKAAQLSGENGFRFPGIGHVDRTNPFTLSLWIKTQANEPRMVVVHHSKAPVDAGSRGYELLLENGRVAFGLHHMWPGNSIKVVTRNAVPINRWTQVAVTYDGSSKAAGVRVYLNGQLAEVEVVRDGLYKDITYDGLGEPDLAIGFRFRDTGFKNGQVDQFRVYDRALTSLEAADLAGRDELARAWNAPADSLTAAQREGLAEYSFANVSGPARAIAADLHALREQLNSMTEPVPEVMVMKELPRPKPCYILKRGAYDAPGEQVWANTPAVLPPMSKSQPRNRLGLAEWLFDPGNPLAARVAVNRLWQQMFGQGLVASSDNFGSQGSPPAHPELLDWLACDFRDPSTGLGQAWDVKRMLKQIAMSATYRQSSRADPDLLNRDPDDKLLTRGPARRLTAEMLRDESLADSGLLVETLGGPSVKPYQPPGVWEVAMGHPNYDQGHGDALHRRSLYTFWKRSVPPPAMMAFDATDRNYCVVHRQSTSTPLQALALLNDVQITEAARFISQRAIREGGAARDQRIAWMFRLITDRGPTDAEMSLLTQMDAEQRQLFMSDPGATKKLLLVGETRNDSSLDPLDLATGTVLAEALLNHDEAIMRR